MSDTIKLSELLAGSAYACEIRRDACQVAEMTEGARLCAAQARALRAIAPALLAAMKDAIGRHIEIEDHNALCSACRLQRILSEAGVTCE